MIGTKLHILNNVKNATDNNIQSDPYISKAVLSTALVNNRNLYKYAYLN